MTRRPPTLAGRTVPEREVQRSAIALLEAYGCVVHRRNTGAFAGEYNGKRRFVRFSERGASDLYGLLPTGHHFECEVKRYGKRPTPEQVRWLMGHNGIGGAVAFWVDNTETLERVLRHVLDGGRIVYTGTRGDYDLA